MVSSPLPRYVSSRSSGRNRAAGGSQPVVRDLDFDTDGTVAVAATAQGPSGFILGILRLDRTGRQTGFIDTGRYYPASIAIASDHSIWTLGWQMAADRPPYPDRQDYMIVRQNHLRADLPSMVQSAR